MDVAGIVRDGVVVLEQGVVLPEGTRVVVQTVEPSLNAPLSPAFTIGDLAVDDGPEDLATNVDHYLYGHPKRTPNG